ncbi:syntabulin isoform X8 [Canis lupus familiaris]|uniref:syntabulin isoform X8 n=1 Tax=Canis lupus familiaris TaxID=9615 RepID=UPI0018F5FF6D|nr:syntabulin isoform X8 [Canis lupus familiaris]XP_038411283.1 syntabulin isoform X8 [Canis lupus familiaris]XP_038411284.1 syntabulin isoform X8 [Canis lupus familiaris]
MGPLRETKEQRVQHHEKEISRSRIPRLILRPHLPQQQHKVSPASESPFSEEESREFNASSSGRSARTISSNSFCSDDTGCPSSQSVSPVKTPSDTGNSPVGFCPGSDEDFSRKKCTIGMVGEGSIQSSRYKKEPKSGLVKPGIVGFECNLKLFNLGSHSSSCLIPKAFSSGDNTRKQWHRKQVAKLILAPRAAPAAFRLLRSTCLRREASGPLSHASRHCFLLSDCEDTLHSRGPHGRSNGASSYKAAGSPPSPREKDLLSMLCRSQLSPVNIHPGYAPSSPSSSNSGSCKGSDGSPVLRRPGRYMSCGENHGVKPPNPEQYLTPLQQKEVTVRHLKTKLKESERRLHERESEIAELKSQLARMREDWIEEECHRVEAQLALKEARKEIKQLRQVIETMRSSLADKDKGIQKYFVDINIQNKKLESLLQSMEMAHSGSLRDELCLHFPCDSPEKSLRPSTPLGQMAEALALEEQGPEEGADGELLLAEATAQGSDLFDGVAAAAATRADALELLRSAPGAEVLALVPGAGRQEEGSAVAEQAVQTDVVPYSPAVSELIQHVLRLQEPWPSSPESPDESGADSPASFPESISAFMVDLTPRNPNSAILLSPVETPYDDEATAGPEAPAHRLMRELDFAGPAEAGAGAEAEARRDGGALLLAARGPAGGQYWSRSFLVDLLAVAAPVVPTVLWAFSTRRGGTDPVYNIGALLRGCCVVALHSLRRTAFHIKT